MWESVVELKGDGGVGLGGLPVSEFEIGHCSIGGGDGAEGVDLFGIGVVVDSLGETVLFEGLIAEGLFVVKGGGGGGLSS